VSRYGNNIRNLLWERVLIRLGGQALNRTSYQVENLIWERMRHHIDNTVNSRVWSRSWSRLWRTL